MKRLVVYPTLAVVLIGAVGARAATITASAMAYVAGASPETDTETNTGADDVWADAATAKGTPWWECGAFFACEHEASWAWASGTADGNLRVGAVHDLGSSGFLEGPFDGSASATVTWEDSWYVDTMYPYFSFNVNNGSLSIWGFDPGSGTLSASYLIQILVAGNEAWRSEGTLTGTYNNGTGWSWDYEDSSGALEEGNISGSVALGYLEASVWFPEQSFTLDLTAYADQTVPITYYMTVSASDPVLGEVGGNWAEARFGDPFIPPPQPVPEPGTLLLFGAGLAGLGAARRHRRRSVR